MATDISTIIAKPPARAWTQELERLVEYIGETVGALSFNRYYAPGLASAISEVEPLSRHLDQVAQRMTMAQAVASREEIAQCLTLLIAAYPNASIKGDLTTFGRMLVEDVASLEPSVAAVDKACRELRQTKTFVPAIAEVIAAVRFAEKRLAVCLQLLDALPEQLAEARGTLEHLERTEAARAEHMKRMRDREESRRTDVPIAERLKELRVRLRLRMDVRTGEFPAELVEQAIAEWERANGKPYVPTYHPPGASTPKAHCEVGQR
jgi:cell division protein FtsB